LKVAGYWPALTCQIPLTMAGLDPAIHGRA